MFSPSCSTNLSIKARKCRFFLRQCQLQELVHIPMAPKQCNWQKNSDHLRKHDFTNFHYCRVSKLWLYHRNHMLRLHFHISGVPMPLARLDHRVPLKWQISLMLHSSELKFARSHCCRMKLIEFHRSQTGNHWYCPHVVYWIQVRWFLKLDGHHHRFVAAISSTVTACQHQAFHIHYFTTFVSNL